METGELRGRYQRLITAHEDPQALLAAPGAVAHPLDAERPPSRTELRIQLGELFQRRPELDAVVLTVGRDVVGVVLRAALGPSADPASPEPTRESPSAADGVNGSLSPGTFERIRLRCRDPKCGEVDTLIFFPKDGQPPLCSKDSAHGRMEQIGP
jgi:hypothetical protein